MFIEGDQFVSASVVAMETKMDPVLIKRSVTLHSEWLARKT